MEKSISKNDACMPNTKLFAMKKSFLALICLLLMMAVGLDVRAQKVTITLNSGWTWISCPWADTVDFAEALGTFTPAVGDIIKSQWSYATYLSNGQWRGAISKFYPGHCYLYKSNRMEPVSLSFFKAPTGAINGIFSVSDSTQVCFSRGNLQYQASSNTWRFAEYQWDYIGSDNSNISSDYDGWIDLFGWGTSGYHDTLDLYNVNYQPWSSSMSQVNGSYNYYGYGPSLNMTDLDFTGTSVKYDWGVYNPISNGGNKVNLWRTLTQTEWSYLFNIRATSSGIRYAKAQVNNVNGVILIPDDWNEAIYSLNNANTSDASFDSNIISASQWTTLENAGAVFLSTAGNRSGTSVNAVGIRGLYWSASYSSVFSSRFVYFGNSFLYSNSNLGRYYGFAVRLVCNVE